MPKVTPQQIQDWKVKHGKVFHMECDGYNAYLRKPTRKDLSYASAGAGNDMLKMTDLLVRQCWLEGDDIFKDDLEYSLTLGTKFQELIKMKEAELKEL